MQVLLAEDDPVLGRALQIGLGDEGLTVDWTRNGREAISTCRSRAYEALILDLGLPDMGGFEILHRIRQFNSDIPIIVVTARGSIDDRIRGLDFGADDYLPKPFELMELVARLRSLERRVGRERASVLTAGSVSIDLSRHVVTLGPRPIELTAFEFAVLQLFMRTNGVLSLAQAARYLDALGDDIDEQAVVACMCLLQAKLDLQFERGESGWRLTPDRTLH